MIFIFLNFPPEGIWDGNIKGIPEPMDAFIYTYEWVDTFSVVRKLCEMDIYY